jgi:hypothetical protein
MKLLMELCTKYLCNNHWLVSDNTFKDANYVSINHMTNEELIQSMPIRPLAMHKSLKAWMRKHADLS